MKKDDITYGILIGIYYLSMFSLLFLKWFNNKEIVTYVNIIGFGLIFILNLKNIKIKSNDLIVVFLLLNFLTINLMFTSEHNYFFSYLIMQTIIPYFSVMFTMLLLKDKEKLKKYILKPSFFILNIYYIVNFWIILKQIDNPSFMLRNFTTNTFYMDHIDGLLGANGTHKLAYFQIFCLFLNTVFFTSKIRIVRVISKIMFWFILITSCYVSVFNDNRIYYFLIIIYFIPFVKLVLGKSKNKSRKKINGKKLIKIFVTIVLICTLTGTLYKTNKKFNTFLRNEIYEKYIYKTYNKISGSMNEGNSSSEERVELLKYSISEGKIIGKGIGAIRPANANDIKKHFALNDVNIRIYNGGIIFAILMVLTYTYSYLKYFKIKHNRLILRLFITISVIVASFSFQPFTYPAQTMIFSLVYLLIAFQTNDNRVEE